MELARLVEVVDRVRATARKTEKVGLLADFLRQTQDKETELTALYLSGSLPQGRIGVGWRMIDEAMPQSAVSRNPLRLVEVDQTFESIAAERPDGHEAGQRIMVLLATSGPAPGRCGCRTYRPGTR